MCHLIFSLSYGEYSGPNGKNIFITIEGKLACCYPCHLERDVTDMSFVFLFSFVLRFICNGDHRVTCHNALENSFLLMLLL